MLCFTNKTRPPHPKDGPWAWFVLSYTFVHGVVIGGITSGYGAILPVLMEALHENRQRTALVGSLALGFGLFFCVVTSKLCERFSCRLIDGIGLICYVVGFTLSSLCSSIYPLYITYSLLTGIAGALTLSANLIIIRKYFKKHYSLATGIMSAGGGVGISVIGPTIQNITDAFGWKNAFRAFAGVLSVMCLFVFIFDPNVEACVETSNPTENEDISSRKKRTKPRKIVLGFLDLSVWTFPEFTICVIAIFFGSWGHYTPLIHMIRYSEELGISPTKSSTLFVFVGIATIVSRLICGRLCDLGFVKPRYIHQAGIIVSGISTILLTFASSYTHLIIFSIFYGIADGAFLLTIYILFLNTVDIPRGPSALGQAYMIVSLANMAGPALGGMMADKAGSYTSSFYMAGSASIVGGLLFFSHLCQNGANSKREQLYLSNVTDHPSACNGPACLEPEEKR